MPEGALAAESLYEAARSAQRLGNARDLERLARKLVALAESSGDVRALAFGHYYLGSSFFWRNDGRSARTHFDKALDAFEDAGDREGIARVKIAVAAVAVDIDLEVARARRLYLEALPAVRELKQDKFLAVALGNLAEVCRLEGDYVPAQRYAAESAELFERDGSYAKAGGQLATMAHLAMLQRAYPEALERMRSAWQQLAREENPRSLAWYFDIAFMLAAGLNRWETAAQLLGFVGHYRDANGAQRLQGILPWFSRPVEKLAEKLGDARALELIRTGEGLTLAQAQALVEELTA